MAKEKENRKSKKRKRDTREKQTRKKKIKRVKVHGNGSFGLIRILLLVILVCSFAFSICDKYCAVISWPDDYANIIGGASQIATAVISFVVSIIGISISLQNEEFFGVKISKLYALRVTKHYTIRGFVVTSIILCGFNLIFYMLDLTFATMGTMAISFAFLLHVICIEIPIMSKDEKALLGILKNNFIDCYLKNGQESKDLIEAIRYLLYRKNLKEIYEYFCDGRDEEYNQDLMFRLLDIQQYFAFSISDKPVEEQRIIGSSLLNNVLDIINRHIDFSDKIYDEIIKNSYLLTRVLFRVKDIPGERNLLFDKIPDVMQGLMFSSDDTEKMDDLLASTIVVLTTETVKNNDFGIVKAIRRQFSQTGWGLKKSSPALLVFCVISLQLYYLCCSEKDVPEELKENIIEFINEKNIVEEGTRITSWKDLFNEAAQEFDLNYEKFLKFTMKHQHNIEYWLFGTGAKFVVLDSRYVTYWYITNLLNTHSLREVDFASLSVNSDSFDSCLVDFAIACFDNNKNFIPTEEMKRIVEFYSDSKHHFEIFIIRENRNHALFDFVNRIKRKKLEEETILAKKMDSGLFAENIKDKLEETLKNEWGFDPTLEIKNSDRYFAVLIELFPDAINFEESIIEYCVRSVLQDIRKAIQKTIVYKGEDLETTINKWLSKKVKYVIGNVKETIPTFFVHNETLKNKFEQKSDLWTIVESELLGFMTLVTDNGFSFNCEIKEIVFDKLSEEELAKQVAKYQREDGQYVFNGTFLSKEKIMQTIRDKFTVLKVVISHQVKSSKKDILELKPYITKQEDD